MAIPNRLPGVLSTATRKALLSPSPADIPADVWEAMRSCELLAEAGDEGIAWLARVSAVHTYRKGQPILSERHPAGEMGLVVSGHVRSVHYDPEGRPLTALLSWPQEPIGLMSSLAEKDYNTTYEAAGTCTVVLFSRESLLRLMRDEPDVMRSVIRTLTKRMTELVTTIKALASEVPTRVAIYIGQRLETQGGDGDDPIEVDLGVTRVELAAVLGTVPETLSRAFHLLQGEGIIESDGRRVIVIDREALRARARGIL